MITQLVTLAGVLIGALTSFLATTVAERTRHRRAMATRWDERKLTTYIEYAACVKEISSTAKRPARRRRTRTSAATISPPWRRPNSARAGGATAHEAGRTLIDLINRCHEQARADLGVPRGV